MAKFVNWSYRTKKLLKMIVTGKRIIDDYDWQFYSDLYMSGLQDVARDHTLVLSPGDYEYVAGKLLLKNQVLPLHPNYQIIYETILQLNPGSVMEIGCGGGITCTIFAYCLRKSNSTVQIPQMGKLNW